MIDRTLAVASILFAVVLPGIASAADDDYAYPPLTNDLAPGYEFTGPEATDIVGVGLGMTRKDAEAAMQAAVPGGELQPGMGGGEQVIGVSDGRGTEVGFVYYPSDSIYAYSGDDGAGTKQSERLEVKYSTALTGERVTSIERDLEFGTQVQPSLPDFVKALEAKYGPPTARQDPTPGAGILDLWFGWKNGKRAMLGRKEAAEFPGVALNTSPFYNCLVLGFNRGGYSYMQQRTDEWPGCTAVLSVKIFVGRRDDLIKTVQMDFYDHRRWYDSAVVADKYLADAFNAALNTTPNAPAPKL